MNMDVHICNTLNTKSYYLYTSNFRIISLAI